jgi:hypothetical protein
MKKLISIILSSLIILNTFGFNIIIFFLIQESRTENLEIIEEHPETIAGKNIIIFSLRDDRPVFINPKEIRYGNELYDIVYKKDNGSDTILYCINDRKENELHTAFRSLNDMNDSPASVPDHLTVNILKNLLKNYLPNPIDHPIKNFNTRQYCLKSFGSVPIVIPEKIYPPPQLHIISC